MKSWAFQSAKSGSANTLPSSFTRLRQSAKEVPLNSSFPSARHQRLRRQSIFARSDFVPPYLTNASPFDQTTMLRSHVSER